MNIKDFKIAIGCDHAGFILKQDLISHYNIPFKDFGTNSEQSVDYPDIANPLAKSIDVNEYNFGILICGSGNGVCMTANKYENVRAALCWNVEIAKLARMHNNANIICIPARFISLELAISIIDSFFETEFEGGRHTLRIKKISSNIK